MGKVMTKLKLANAGDEGMVRAGLLAPDQVRHIEVDALVDTGATRLVLPTDIVAFLGLPQIDRWSVRLADGTVREIPVVGDLRIEILGRWMHGDALVTPAGTMPLIGQIPLEGLDLVVKPGSKEIIPNPDHPDGPIFDLLAAS
jgi:clan AA aspartic protease